MRDRPLLLALWALALDRLRMLQAVSILDHANRQTLRRRLLLLLLLLLDTLEHSVERALCSIDKRQRGSGSALCGV